mmetsp:Transcript_31611/g.57978  ORF Transcript_31611/g.57978 Transcript_31611/m.57978 type:complete len:234 (+) Transcript_31611:112-813(+)
MSSSAGAYSLGFATALGASALAYVLLKQKEKDAAPAKPVPVRLAAGKTIFLLCDVQERFRTTIHAMPHVIATAKTLLACADVMSVPVVVTEQYPKALLHTVEELDVSKAKVFEKTLFSMCTDQVMAHLETLEGRDTVVLFGVEAHVCMQQTALDLLARGYAVNVVADGASSSRPNERTTALERMRQAGVYITTAESVMFELLRSKDAAQFKQISGLAKSHGDAYKSLAEPKLT